MAERSGQGFEVRATRVDGAPDAGRERRRRRLPIVLVLILAVSVPAVAVVGPRTIWRPEFISLFQPTPGPSPTPTPRPTRRPDPNALPTPLPAVTFGGEPRPTEPFAIFADGLRVVDPVTGDVRSVADNLAGDSLMFTEPDGRGWWCLCLSYGGTSFADRVEAALIRFDLDGRASTRSELASFASSATPGADDVTPRLWAAVTDDQSVIFLATAIREGDRWTASVDAFRTASGAHEWGVELGSLDVPATLDPADPSFRPDAVQSWLEGPQIRVSPDESRLVAWMSVVEYSPTSGEFLESRDLAWDLQLRGRPSSEPPVVQSLGDAVGASLRPCWGMTWLSADRVGGLCFDHQGYPTEPHRFRVLELDGTIRHDHPIHPSEDGRIGEPLVDRANGLSYLWLPSQHEMVRFDAIGGGVDRLVVDPDAPVIGATAGRPTADRAPSWEGSPPAWYQPIAVADPGSSRIYAIGQRGPVANSQWFGPPPTGIFVFDARNLSLVAHWAPVAAYATLGLSADGRWLYALGVPGMDEEGREANWEASLTIIDTRDGHVALRLGRLGQVGDLRPIRP